jgi:hypothetical protein
MGGIGNIHDVALARRNDLNVTQFDRDVRAALAILAKGQAICLAPNYGVGVGRFSMILENTFPAEGPSADRMMTTQQAARTHTISRTAMIMRMVGKLLWAAGEAG